MAGDADDQGGPAAAPDGASEPHVPGAEGGPEERSFARLASHELRSPLTVIKMSADMLADELSLSGFAARSVQRIRRAARDMEATISALHALARAAEPGAAEAEETFVVNDVLRQALDEARQASGDDAPALRLAEPARFAVRGSARAFGMLCAQLLRHAGRHAVGDAVEVCVQPGAVTFVGARWPEDWGAAAQSFELMVARRLGERFGWGLGFDVGAGGERVARLWLPRQAQLVEVAGGA